MNTIMKQQKYYFILTICLLLLSFASLAKVTASVDRTQIVIGETFTLKITVDKNTNEQPDLSDLEQVFTVLGTSQASSTQIINGSYSVKKTWEVSLMPKSVGNNTIPPIKLGNEMTRAIQIKVTRSDPNAKANGDIFIEFSADKSEAYVKEQVLLTVKLFYGISLSEGNLSPPTASHAVISELGKDTTYVTNRNGRSYTVNERHYALFAEQSGKLDLNPIIFNGRDNSSRRSFSMFSTGKPVRAVSKPLSLTIKPIPQNALGKAWLPAKNVQLSQEWSKAPYKVGEPITRTITLFVEGLSETQIPDIKLGDIDDIRVYPEQPQTQTEKNQQTLKAYKQVKFALIAMHAGDIKIPEFSLQWFNTKTGKLEYAKLPPTVLHVEADKNAATMPLTNLHEKAQAKPATATKDNSASQKPATSVKIVEKDNKLWQILTALFALLWIATMVLYFKKKTLKKPQEKPVATVNISKNSLIEAVNKKDLKQLERNLIRWWNQQYSKHQVTNLSQIKTYVQQPMQQLIDVLELQLYNPDAKTRFNQNLWLKQINGKGLNLIKNSANQTKDKLPDLY